MTESQVGTNKRRLRLAIIGGGSSGLVCLKMALDLLKDWEVVCLEKSDHITGCWGNPYPGFVSTSTRYTTQFACYPICDATIHSDGGASRGEFFCDGEYGQYLESFADSFGLRQHVFLNCHVDRLRRSDSAGWDLFVNGEIDHFDAVVICTGLAARPKPIQCGIPELSVAELNQVEGLNHVTGKRIVVIGGGESAADYANRLSRPELNNEVYLSLHSGIRVSPRYHPVRGVPSDFLRNRLMLSVHEDIRNWLGQIFVELRIKYQEQFERLFPPRYSKGSSKKAKTSGDPGATPPHFASGADQVRKEWAFKLTKAAKDDLFNMFHNKSDDFLEAVGEGRIKIVGVATDQSHNTFLGFGSNAADDETIELQPELIVPAIGFQSTLDSLTGGTVKLTDFYMGCCHEKYSDLFLVGFARPIIGNIPTISEMQARYVCGLIGDVFSRPSNMQRRHKVDLETNRRRFRRLDLESTYPVEMIPYCDRLANSMELSLGPHWSQSVGSWIRVMLAPASTMHYFHDESRIRKFFQSAPIYMPAALILFVLLMKPVDWTYRFWRRVIQ